MPTQKRWHALLLSGQRPRPDPLAQAFGGTVKALVPILGEAMVSRVARTLLACPAISGVTILAQKPESLTLEADTRWMATHPDIQLATSGAGIASSILAVAGSADAPWPLLVTTADHVLLTPATIAAFLNGVGDSDIAVGFVERATILKAWPDSRRTWLKFRGGWYTGANLFALSGPAASPAVALWRKVEQDRKSAFKLIRAFGPALLLRFLTRSISLERGFAVAGAKLGVRATPVVLDDARAGMDVDKLSDHRAAEAILRQDAA